MTAYMDIDIFNPSGEISEEILGAYLEGNLNESEEAAVDALLVSDNDTSLMLRDIAQDSSDIELYDNMPLEYTDEVDSLFAGLDDHEEFFIPGPVAIDTDTDTDTDTDIRDIYYDDRAYYDDIAVAAEPSDIPGDIPGDTIYPGADDGLSDPMPDDPAGYPDFL